MILQNRNCYTAVTFSPALDGCYSVICGMSCQLNGPKGRQTGAYSMLKIRIGGKFVIYLICRVDFGTIGYENQNNDKIALAFDRKYREHVHSVELVSQSIYSTNRFAFILATFFSFFLNWQFFIVDISLTNICNILRLITIRLNSQNWIKRIYWKYVWLDFKNS